MAVGAEAVDEVLVGLLGELEGESEEPDDVVPEEPPEEVLVSRAERESVR